MPGHLIPHLREQAKDHLGRIALYHLKLSPAGQVVEEDRQNALFCNRNSCLTAHGLY